jgi:hypothetical protein
MTPRMATPHRGVMKKKYTSDNVTCAFVAKPSADVTGVVSGFDRLRLRGTLRALYQPTVLSRRLSGDTTVAKRS